MKTSDCVAYLSEVKGASYDEYRRKWDAHGTAYEEDQCHPLQLNISLTSYCNLRCKMCYWNFNENKPREYMPLEMVDQIVSEAKELQIASIWLGSYTESLLHPQIIEVLEKFAEIGAPDYWLATNGTLLSEEISEKIIELPITWLTISLDAATAETYKCIRGGNLSTVENNILKFLEIRARKHARLPFLRVSFVDMAENRNELEAFKKKWEKLADIIDVQTFVDFSETGVQADVDKSFTCQNPFRLLSIMHDGELRPCCNFAYKNDTQKFYLRNMSIKQFWESSFHKKLCESIRNRQYLPCCAECVRRFKRTV